MKILFIITGLGPGGAEKQLCDIADELVQNGHQIKILYLLHTRPFFTPRHSAIDVISLGIGKKSIFQVVRALWNARKIIQQFTPDIVHSHMFHANIFARILRIFVPMKVLISTAHSSHEGGKWRMLLYRWTDFLSDLTTNVSKDAVTQFIKKGAVPARKILCVHNGINTNIFSFHEEKRKNLRKKYGVADREKILLAIGRLSDEKDYPTLLKAFAFIRKHRKDVQLWIVGDGPNRWDLQKLARKLGVEDTVHFWGVQRDIVAFLSACDIFCHTSVYEGFGIAVAEAMACERPVVVTKCGGVEEVVDRYGVLVPPSHPPEVAKGILYYCNMPSDSVKKYTKNGRQHIIEYFSITSVVKRWLTIYDELMKG